MYLSKWHLDLIAKNKTQTLTAGLLGSLHGDIKDNAIPPEVWNARVGLYGCAGSVISVLGMVGVVLSLVVLVSFRQNSAAPRLLMWLEGFGGLLLLSCLCLDTLPTVSKGGLLPESFVISMRPVFARMYPVPHVAQTGVAYMTLAVTFERYLAVVKPFHVQRIFGPRTHWGAGVLVTSWAVLYHMPLYMAYTFDTAEPWSDGHEPVFHRTSFGESTFYNYWYVIWVNLFLEFIVPFIVIAVLNTIVVVTLVRSKGFQSNCTRSGGRELGRLNAIMLAVTSTFFVCQLLPASALIAVSGHNRYEDCSNSCNVFTAIADTMVLINPAANFILYCAIGDRFRQRLRECMSCSRLRALYSSSSPSTSRTRSQTKETAK